MPSETLFFKHYLTLDKVIKASVKIYLRYYIDTTPGCFLGFATIIMGLKR